MHLIGASWCRCGEVGCPIIESGVPFFQGRRSPLLRESQVCAVKCDAERQVVMGKVVIA